MTFWERLGAAAIALVLAIALASLIGNRQFSHCLGSSHSVTRAEQCAGLTTSRPGHPAASPSPKENRRHA